MAAHIRAQMTLLIPTPYAIIAQNLTSILKTLGNTIYDQFCLLLEHEGLRTRSPVPLFQR